MSFGDSFAVQSTTARTNVSNTVASTETYGSTPQLEQGDWSGEWERQNSNRLSIPAAVAGSRVLFGHSKFVRSSGTQRAVGPDVISRNGTELNQKGAGTSRYVRLSGGADEGQTHGAMAWDSFAVAEDDEFSIVRGHAFDSVDRVGDYDKTAGDPQGFWAVHLDDTSDFLAAELNSASVSASGKYGNTPRPIDIGPTPEALTSGSWATMDWLQDFAEGTGISISGGNGGTEIDVQADRRLLVNLTWVTDGPTDRSSVLVILELDEGSGFEVVPGGIGSTYVRNGSSDIMVGGIHVPVIVSSGATTPQLRVRFVDQCEESGTFEVGIVNAYITIFDLGSRDIVIAGSDARVTTLNNTWDAHDFNQTITEEGTSLEHDPTTNNSRITNDAGETITVLCGWAGLWDRSAATNATRKNPHTQIARNGTRLDYAVAGEFSRGAQSGDDCFVAGYSVLLPVELAATQYIEAHFRCLASNANSDMVVANDLWTGTEIFWAVRMDPASTGGPGPVPGPVVGSLAQMGFGR